VFFSTERAAPKGIIVTAAQRRDGATQIAISLAMVGAEASRERRVILVDFNLRNPGIAEILDIPREPGVSDVLDGRCSLDAAIQAVTLKNGNQLHVLPSGPGVEKPLGLLKSRQVQSLIARLVERYDHTIIDVTASNAHPDPQVLGAMVDGALLVVRAGETPRETVAEAKKRLDLAGVRCLGLVLNQRTDPIPGFVYRMT
jgi:capsular exopolysaccharide synthesis family protein